MSTTEQDPTSDAARRRFDEVASLFGAIVPPAGSPVRPRVPLQPSALPQVPDSALEGGDGPLAPPPTLRAPVVEPVRSRQGTEKLSAFVPLSVSPVPPAPAETVRLKRPPIEAAPAPVEAKGKRKAAGEVPWPDAFAPRPNYRQGQKGRSLYWLFVLPFAAVVAVAVTFIDPRAIRTFVDQTLPRYLPAEVTQLFARPNRPAQPAPFPPTITPPPPSSAAAPDDTPIPLAPALMPAPSSAPASPAADTPPVSAAPAPSEPVAPPASVAPAPVQEPAPAAAPEPSSSPAAAEAASPSAASESQAIPVPPQPPAPAPAATPVPMRITVYYRHNEGGAEGEARRLAARVGNAEIRPAGTTPRSPLIYYYNPADRDAATAVARTLAGEGAAGWIVRAGPARPNTGVIDVLLP